MSVRTETVFRAPRIIPSRIARTRPREIALRGIATAARRKFLRASDQRSKPRFLRFASFVCAFPFRRIRRTYANSVAELFNKNSNQRSAASERISTWIQQTMLRSPFSISVEKIVITEVYHACIQFHYGGWNDRLAISFGYLHASKSPSVPRSREILERSVGHRHYLLCSRDPARAGMAERRISNSAENLWRHGGPAALVVVPQKERALPPLLPDFCARCVFGSREICGPGDSTI